MAKRKQTQPEKPATPPPILTRKPDIPTELANFKATLKRITSGAFQKRVLAHYAKEATLTFMQSLMESSANGDVRASITLAQIYKVLESKSLVSVVNNVDARSVNLEVGESEGTTRSYANIARNFTAERERRQLMSGGPHTLDATFVATPEGPRED